MHAGAGDDYVEGNSGSDDLHGDGGNDDVLGGSSSRAGLPLGAEGHRLTQGLNALVDSSAAGLPDGVDEIHGGAGQDVVLGDNGRITRPRRAAIRAGDPYRDVAMADVRPGRTSGSDVLHGGDGDDVLYGQLDDAAPGDLGAGDHLFGDAGADAVVGDLAVVHPTPAGQLARPSTLRLHKSGVAEDVYQAGTLVPVTRVPEGLAEVGGSDIADGGPGDDVLRTGAGRDLANGGAGDDVVLGGAGDDALWGGTGHDRLFGGYGQDDLDLKPRADDPAVYAQVAGEEDTDDLASTTNGADLVYGGWGADELQADVGGAGHHQPATDQLVDWVGNHNVYYVCGGASGQGRVYRQSSPAMQSLLTDLVVAAGDTDVESRGSAGWLDLGLVTNKDKRSNNKPSPEAPGHFTCEGTG